MLLSVVFFTEQRADTILDSAAKEETVDLGFDALLDVPGIVDIDAEGNFYIPDLENQRVRKMGSK